MAGAEMSLEGPGRGLAFSSRRTCRACRQLGTRCRPPPMPQIKEDGGEGHGKGLDSGQILEAEANRIGCGIMAKHHGKGRARGSSGV